MGAIQRRIRVFLGVNRVWDYLHALNPSSASGLDYTLLRRSHAHSRQDAFIALLKGLQMSQRLSA